MKEVTGVVVFRDLKSRYLSRRGKQGFVSHTCILQVPCL